MKQSILALIMALILCIGAVPAEVMAAEYSDGTTRSTENVLEKYNEGVSGNSTEYVKDTAVKDIPADKAAFNPYVFDVSENGDNARVKLEPKLMSAASNAKKDLILPGNSTILIPGNVTGVLPGNGTWVMPGNSTGETSGNDTEGNEYEDGQFDADCIYTINGSNAVVGLTWPCFNNASFYRLRALIKVNDSYALINDTKVYDEKFIPYGEENVLPCKINNDSAALRNFNISILDNDQKQFNVTDQATYASGIKYGDKVIFRITPVIVTGGQNVMAKPIDTSFTLLGDSPLPEKPDRAVYNLNDKLWMNFETEEMDSSYYEVVGLSKQNPGGDREPITINGTSYYVFGKSNVNRSAAQISNITKEGGVLANDVTFNTSLEALHVNATSIMPAIGENVFFSVRTEKSHFGTPINETVGCNVPALKSAVVINQTATVDFITNDVNMSYFDICGFVKNEEGGAIHIGNGTYNEFGRYRCDSKAAEFLVNSTDEKGCPVSEVRVSALISQLNETAAPVKPGDTLYFAVDTEHGRDAEKTFYGDTETAGFSNLIETVVKEKTEKDTPVITAKNITKTAKTKAQSFSLGAVTNGGQLSFNSSNPNVIVNSAGKVTIKKNFTGKAVITIKSAENDNYKAATKKVTITVKPAKVSLKKVKNVKKRKARATWKKSPITTITGYQIRYSTSKKFTKSKTKIKTIKGRKKTKFVTPRLKKGKKYYFQIRAYKQTSAGKLYSGWSKSKKVKIKK